MTLSFSQKWPKSMGELAGQPNFFIEKIWEGLINNEMCDELAYDFYKVNHLHLSDDYWDVQPLELLNKIHTIRADPSDRWKAGIDIHMVINNRTKHRFQFAPTIKCVSVQNIEVKHNVRTDDLKYDKDGWSIFGCDIYGNRKRVLVDEIDLSWEGIKDLAINDGFPSAEAFFQYFNKDFVGKITHWSDLKY